MLDTQSRDLATNEFKPEILSQSADFEVTQHLFEKLVEEKTNAGPKSGFFQFGKIFGNFGPKNPEKYVSAGIINPTIRLQEQSENCLYGPAPKLSHFS
jgi:hypothetical protein